MASRKGENRGMWVLAWKGVFSAKFRTALTLLGVALGTFALTTMGSMSLHFHTMSAHFKLFVQDKLFIRDRSGFFGGGVLDEQELRHLSHYPGIEQVAPVVVARLHRHEVVVFGLPQIAIGIPLKAVPTLFGSAPLLWGHWPEHENECLLGADIAQNKAANNTFVYSGKSFHIAGVMARTGGQEDGEAVFSLSALERLLGRNGIVSYGIVVVNRSVSTIALAHSIEAAHPQWEVIPPDVLSQELHRSEALWDALTVGTGLLAALIGGIGILTAMMMSVQERLKEIAITKSLGAGGSQIFLTFFFEALIIAVFGSVLGFLFGYLFIEQANVMLAKQGMTLFEPTIHLLGLNFAFALMLALFGGVYPAMHGARLKIAAALRR